MRLHVSALSFAIFAIAFSGCGSSPEPAKTEPAPAPPPARVMDHTASLPQANLVASRLVTDHILDIPKLPGGSLGEYERKGRKYQMFIVDADTNQKAAFLLIDMKGVIGGDDYISYMGGYFGKDAAGRQIYTFAKLHYLAGVVGLSKAEADPLARDLASHLQ